MPRIIILEEPIQKFAEGGKWIQKATASIKRRGTEGVCTGSKFGGPSCPAGSRRYNLAKTFRKMARNREDGGELMEYAEGGNMESPCISCSGYAMCGGHLKRHANGGPLDGISEQSYDIRQPLFTDNTPTFNINNAVDTTSTPITIPQQTPQNEPYRGSNLPLFMGIGTGLANLALAASVKTPKDITPITINPGKIDSNPMRRDILENAARSRANRLAALRASGISPAQYMSAVSTGDADINQATANAIRQNEFDIQSKNIAMNQAAQEANAKAINEANLYNAQQKYGAQQQRRSYITNALQGVSGGVKDYLTERQKYDTLGAVNDYYDIVKDKYSRPKFVPKRRD